MVIDCHYHLDERYLTIDEMIVRMDTAGISRVALMGSMVEPFPEPARWLLSPLQFLFSRRLTRGIVRGIIEKFTPEGNIIILGKPYELYSHPDNVPVFEAVKLHPKRFLAWAFVRPGSDIDPSAELARWKDAPGFIGVKAHPFWHRFDPVLLLPVAETLCALSKPLLIHAGFGGNGDFMPLVHEASGLKLILAHAGFPEFSDTWKQIRERKNIIVDLSQTSYVGDTITRAVVEYLGVDRCIFGTDGPYGFHAADGKFDFGFIRRRIERLFPDAGVQRRLLGENFAEIAGL